MERPLPAEKWIHDIETIKILADERRLRLLELLAEPAAVKGLSAAVGLPPSKLYYHINLLEEHGLIEVVDHNIDGGIVEKIYRVTARQFKLVNPLLNRDLPPETAESLLLPLLDETTQHFRRALAARGAAEESPPRHPFFSKKKFRLTESQLEALHGKLDALMREVAVLGEENEEKALPTYELALVFYQTPPQKEK